jgi:nickel superoxide dismutase
MEYLRTKKLFILIVISVIMLSTGIVRSHCQVPCGIYDDDARFDLIAENIETMEKCNRSIRSLSKQSPLNMNQIVRWIETKETHADSNIEILSAYFLAQRIKPVGTLDSEDYQAYTAMLAQVHQLVIFSSKAKQDVEKASTDTLKAVLAKFKESYTSSVK